MGYEENVLNILFKKEKGDKFSKVFFSPQLCSYFPSISSDFLGSIGSETHLNLLHKTSNADAR